MVVSQGDVWFIVALDRTQLTERVGKLPPRHVTAVVNGIDAILGR